MLINSDEARIVGKNAYVNGYKFVNGEWKRKWSENLMDGEWVELIHKDFEFDFKGEPAGHYARGRVIKWYDNEFCLVELFCNGKRYKVSKQIVAHHKNKTNSRDKGGLK